MNPLAILPDDSNPLAARPTWADAMDYNVKAYQDWARKRLEEGIRLGLNDPVTGWPTDAGYRDAGNQVAMALLGGSVAPKAIRVWHGSPAKFDKFDLEKTGTGAFEGDRFFKDLPKAGYFTTSKEHAARYGEPMEFELNASGFKKINPSKEIKSWVKDMGYKNVDDMIKGYYEGNAYKALDLDRFLNNHLLDAKAAGHKGIAVDLNKIRMHDGIGEQLGTFYVVADPSLINKVK